LSDKYSQHFYQSIHEGADRSAQLIVPLLMAEYHPLSVVDVGCGSGVWLAAFQRAGVTDILGIDGDYARRRGLAIPDACFISHDLTRPFLSSRLFDLVLSLEVAEHLPPRAAAQFVKTLTSLGPVIAFSAAVPYQQGTRHVNTQWPSYWARLFASHGYSPSVHLRDKTWRLGHAEPWYVQNLLIFTSQAHSCAHISRDSWDWPLDVVHPATYLRLADPDAASLQSSIRLTASLLHRRIRKVLDQRRNRP
jgi:SAM-dependent methyltransferase